MTLEPALLERLSSLGEVRAVRDLVGGRGRTFAVEHASSLTTVVHLRRGGDAALEREALATGRAHDAGVGPEVLDVVPGCDALVTRWVPGAVLTGTDLADAATLRAVGAAIARLHAHGDPTGLPRLDPLAVRRDYLERADRRGVAESEDLARERRRTDRLAADLGAVAAAAEVLCHGDLVPANLVSGVDGVTVLDFEYAGVADPAFDLGGLAATAELDAKGVAVLVGSYQERAGDGATLERVLAWRDLSRHAWVVWVALGGELGPERERWEGWARRSVARWGRD